MTTKEILKSYFQHGSIPDEAQFAALIDAMKLEDGINSVVNQKTLFVDPNGDDEIAQAGEILHPFCRISSAIDYLRRNGLQDYTIIVFSGIYTIEDIWLFTNDISEEGIINNNNNNTTVKFIGGVTIINNGKLITIDNSNAGGSSVNVSLIGDAKGNIYKDINTNVLIHTNNGNNISFYSSSTSQSDKSDINLDITNISFVCGKKGYGTGYGSGWSLNDMYNITYSGYITGLFTAQNCSFKNYVTSNWSCPTSSSLALWDATVKIKNTYWETDSNYQYNNWRFNDTTNLGNVVNFSIEETKFFKRGVYSYQSEHIYTNSFYMDSRMIVSLSNVLFYSIASGTCIWNNICRGVHTTGVKLYIYSIVISNHGSFTNVDIVNPFNHLITNGDLPDISLLEQ